MPVPRKYSYDTDFSNNLFVGNCYAYFFLNFREGFNKSYCLSHNKINLTSFVRNVNEIKTYEYLRGTSYLETFTSAAATAKRVGTRGAAFCCPLDVIVRHSHCDGTDCCCISNLFF